MRIQTAYFARPEVRARKFKLPLDLLISGPAVLLLLLSVLMIYSTTAVQSSELYGSTAAMVKRHLAHIVAGLFLLALCMRIPLHFLRRYSTTLFVLGLLLLALVLIPGIGDRAGGAQRWLALGPLRLQPGEFVKVFIIIFFAEYIARYQDRMTLLFPGVLLPFLLVSTVAVLFLAEPDFGSTVIVLSVVLFQLFTRARVLHLLGVGLFGLANLSLLVLTSPYRLRRFQAFLDPFHDPANTSYQLMQSLIAVGSGGLAGVGLGAGQQKLYYLPAAHTDFIYAVIAEELGMAGALAVLVLFMLIAAGGICVAVRLSKNVFYCALAVGCTTALVVPALLNIGVVTGLLPTKGLVLPLVAYGGSAMIANLAILGILLRLAKESNTQTV